MKLIQIPEITDPCTQSWERMPGTARIRHCAACDRDVVNLAAMSAAEVQRLLAGPLPCMRIVRREDGSLLTTEPPAEPLRPRIAAGLLSAALALGSAAAQSGPPTHVTLGKRVPVATLSGRISDHTGHPAGLLLAVLFDAANHRQPVTLAPDGSFRVAASQGTYQLQITGLEIEPKNVAVILGNSQHPILPIEVAIRPARMGFVTLGAPPVQPPKK